MEKYKEYSNILNNICKEKFIQLNYKKINDGYRINYITINGNKEYNKTIVFSSGIHGDEECSPYAILEFLKNYKEITSDKRVIIFPVVNPYGFDRNSRHNAFRQDVNRRFCDKLLAGEAKAIYDVLKKVKPDLFVSLHEWAAKDGYYMYCSDLINKEKLSEIPKIASKYFKVFDDKKINKERTKDGIIWHPDKEYQDTRSRCTLENKMYNDGTHYICIETPSKADLEKRVRCQLEIIEFILEKL